MKIPQLNPPNGNGADAAIVTLVDPEALPPLPVLAPPSADEPERTPEALAEFRKDTATIRRGRQAFVETGLALTRIWNTRRFRWLGYPTMEEYLDKEWDMGPRQAQQLRADAEVVRMLQADQKASNCSLFIPENDAQARPLTRLHSHELRRHAALEIVKAAAGGKVTARIVETVCRQLRGLPAGPGTPTAFPAEPVPVPALAQTPAAAPAGLATKPPPMSRDRQLRETAEAAIAWTAALRDMIGTPDNTQIAEAMEGAVADLEKIKDHYFAHRLRRP
jgi:hypothetical protein